MSVTIGLDELHRLAKRAMDSGQAGSVEEAMSQLQGLQLNLIVHDSDCAAHQAALLTAVSLARRVFLGGVFVSGDLDTPLRAPLPYGPTLLSAVCALGGRVNGPSPVLPTISVGGQPTSASEGFHVRTVFAGWRGGVVPATASALAELNAMPIAAMLSAALAVSQAFLFAGGESKVSARQTIGLSLWDLSKRDWWEEDNAPALSVLPSKLWLIGLGHLGQAYLWGLSLLPYGTSDSLNLVLQDIDVITASTESTSVLTTGDMIGEMKTRAMGRWAKARGFNTALVERRFDENCVRQDCEPAIALCGIDNALGRRALDQVGFKFIVEAGLGSGHRNFQTLRLHTLPGARTASEIWKDNAGGEDLTDRVAYQRLLKQGTLDQCGITQLADRAVGAPFVGSVAATLALSEVLRLLHGAPLSQLIELDLKSIEHRVVVARRDSLAALNPGFVKVN